MTNITIELCTEDRARIDRLTEALEAMAQNQPKTEKPAEAEKKTPAVTVEDIRSKYMSLAASPKKKDAVMLIKLYADKISEIPEDKRAEVLEKLTALEG